MQRRSFLVNLVAGAAALAAAPAGVTAAMEYTPTVRYLRPPGSLPEEQFIGRCIRCGQCGESCPNRCIKFFSLNSGTLSYNTPYITPREQGCILCMKCGEVCPTGAIQEIPRAAQNIIDHVKMGRAVIDKSLCLSYQGKTCGVCYRACPLQDVAIKVGMLEQPRVLDDCVGCGLCERSCIQIPQAIRIIPNSA